MRGVAVLMTCHNRVKKTVACLEHLAAQHLDPETKVTVYLVDDGSTDGTSRKVAEKFPEVRLLEGDGSLFWNRGMHKAFSAALEDSFDYVLWLNDDTFLYPDALSTMLSLHRERSEQGEDATIVAASTRDPETGEFTYGGYRVKRGLLNPLDLELIVPRSEPQRCDTFCGNCVLIPKSVVDVIGNMDPAYQHRWGDVDYGLRAARAGCHSWIPAGYQGECGANPNADRWRLPGMGFRERIAELHSLKGLGKSDWLRYARLHGGPLWPLLWVRPYLRIALASLGGI